MRGRQAISILICALLLVGSAVPATAQAAAKMKLRYDIAISDYAEGKAKVTLQIDNVSVNTLKIREHGYHGYYNTLGQLRVTGDNGKTLSYKQSGTLEGIAGTKGREWSIEAKGNSRIVIEYEIFKQEFSQQAGEYRGYIGNGFAAFSGEQLLIYPSDQGNIDSNIEVRFSLPPDSQAITPWLERAGVYYPNGYGQASGVLDNLMRSSIALGNFALASREVGDTKVKVALPREYQATERTELADNVFDLLAYFNTTFGQSVGQEYLCIYLPEAQDGRRIWAGEWSYSQAVSAEAEGIQYSMVAHQMFHRWNGWEWGWRTEDNTYGALLSEGIARYYESKALNTLKSEGQLSTEHPADEGYLERTYAEYAGKDRSADLIYAKAKSSSPDREELWTAYDKGALIAFALDMKIIEDTKGKKSLDDLTRNLFSSYGHYRGQITYTGLLAAIKNLTGKDYSGFFKDYVFNTRYLDLDPYFEDDDADGLANYLEMSNGTYPLPYQGETVGTNGTRLGGVNRYETARIIADAAYPEGNVENVILASGRNWYDALLGSALSLKYDAPILLVNKEPQDSPDALNFIRSRLKEGGRVYLIGNTEMISDAYVNALAGAGVSGSNVQRLTGSTKNNTALAVARELNPAPGGTVIIASDQDYPDSLSISGYAAMHEAPILITPRDRLPAGYWEYLTELQPAKIIIVGGTGVVGSGIEQELKTITPEVYRYAGANRYATSQAILTGLYQGDIGELSFASGLNYPDALAGSAYSAVKGSPIVMLPAKFDPGTSEILRSYRGASYTIFGGTGVVSAATANNLKALLE